MGGLMLVAIAPGCTMTYSETGPATVNSVERQVLHPGQSLPYDVAQQADGELLAVQLQPASCMTQTLERSVATETTYRKPTFMGSYGFMLGGAALGGLGAAAYVSSKNDPASCAPDDNSCTSKDQAPGLAYALWGVGAAGIIYGVYRALQPPKVESSRPVSDERTVDGSDAACNVPVEGVPVTLLAEGYKPYTVSTNHEGIAVFRLHVGREPPTGALVIRDFQPALGVDLSAFASPVPAAPPSEDSTGPSSPAEPRTNQCTEPDNWSDTAFPWLLLNGSCQALVDKAQTSVLEWGVEKAADKLAEEFTQSEVWQPLVASILADILKEVAKDASTPARQRTAAAICCAMHSRLAH